MSLPRGTVPFLFVNKDDNRPFTDALKLASIFIKGDTLKGRSSLESMLLAYYPFQLRRWGEGSLLLDLLGLNQVSLKVRINPNLNIFKRELDNSSVNPEEFQRLLRRRSDFFKDFSGEKTYTIRGLLNPPSLSDLKNIQEKIINFTDIPSHFLFAPLLKENDVLTILNSLNLIKKDLNNDIDELEKIQKYLNESLDVIKKVISEETANIRDSSVKAKSKMQRDLKKKREMLKKTLDKDVNKMKEQLSKKTLILKKERNKQKRKITRLSNRLDRYKSNGEKEKLDNLNNELRDHKEKLQEMNLAIKALEAETNQEIQVVKNAFKREINSEQIIIKSEETKYHRAINLQKKLLVGITTESKNILKQINSLIKKKHTRLDFVNKYCIKDKQSESELYIPFYIFRYSNEKFSHLPPIEVAVARGFLSKFRRILADTLESKIDSLIKPQGLFTNPYLVTALNSLDKNSSLQQTFLRDESQYNLFKSRSGMDYIMKGLVELRRRTVISDAEYIRLQIDLVERLGEITRQ